MNSSHGKAQGNPHKGGELVKPLFLKEQPSGSSPIDKGMD